MSFNLDNMNEKPIITITRILLIFSAIGIAVILIVRVPRALLRSNDAPGTQKKCKKDNLYHFKDPTNHPYDC